MPETLEKPIQLNTYYWSVKQTCHYFNVSKSTLYRWMNRRKDSLPYFQRSEEKREFLPDQVKWWREKNPHG